MQRKPDRVEAGSIRDASIETGAVCNLRCPFCVTGNGTIALSRGLLSLENFTRILDSLKGLKTAALFNWGEPLLNPALNDMIRLASSRGVASVVSTNLSLPAFDAAAARGLVASGLARLTVSCDGASQKTYELYRVGGSYATVMRNVSLILAAKKELGSPTPAVVWQFLIHRGNQHELRAAEAAAKRLEIPVRFLRLGVPSDEEGRWAPDAKVLDEFFSRRGGRARGKNTPAPAAAAEHDDPTSPGVLCLQAWGAPAIHADGSVLPCCVVSDPKYSLGNVFEEPLESIWNKPLAVAMRRYLRAGIKSDLRLPCYGCPHDPNAGARSAKG
jgi:radical SAM protein with 4Fe4S-binding SPASM domain